MFITVCCGPLQLLDIPRPVVCKTNYGLQNNKHGGTIAHGQYNTD